MKKISKMKDFEYNQHTNILTLSIRGIFDKQKAGLLYDNLTQAIENFKLGFTVITDLSGLGYMGKESSSYIEKIMDLFNQHDVRQILRIIPNPDKDIGFNIMSLFHYSSEVKIHTFESIEQLNDYLKAHNSE